MKVSVYIDQVLFNQALRAAKDSVPKNRPLGSNGSINGNKIPRLVEAYTEWP